MENCNYGLLCASHIEATLDDSNIQSICVPRDQCLAGQPYTATNGDPDSVQGIEFIITGETACVEPNYVNAAKIAQDHSCAHDEHHCQAGLECAAEIVDQDDEANV